MNGKRLAMGLLLLLTLPPVRLGLESRMSLQMGVEWPLLLLIGWLLAPRLAGRRPLTHRIDADGLLSATIASCIAAYWMLPAALDLAVMEPAVACIKYVQWLAAGYLMQRASRRASRGVTAFFLINAAWMLVTAGLLYIDAEEQLCVNYLAGDQQMAGIALLAWAVVLAAMAVARLRGSAARDLVKALAKPPQPRRRRRFTAATQASPASIKAALAGSGTGDGAGEN